MGRIERTAARFLRAFFAGGGRGAAALCAALTLVGCAGPRETFDFGPTSVGRLRAGGVVVAVAEPVAPALIDSNRFVIRGENGDLNYLADAQWSDRLPRLVEARLIEKLEAHGLEAVRPGALAAYQLTTELRRFEIDSPRQAAIVEIVAHVVSDKSGARLAEAAFLGEAPAPHTLGPEAARAYEAALDQAADRLALWLRRRI